MHLVALRALQEALAQQWVPVSPHITIASTLDLGLADAAAAERHARGTAWATTATATILKPCSHGTCAISPSAPTPYPNRIIARTDGPENPTHAANAPGNPARRMPSVMPVWLLAGPGRNWHNAMMSR